MKETILRNLAVFLEIRNKQPGITLADRYYYDMFYEDVIKHIYYIAYLKLSDYGEDIIRKIVILNKIDITNYIFSSEVYKDINELLLEVHTIPYLFEIDNMHILLNAIKETTEPIILSNIKISTYFNFLIINETTMFFKYEVYKCEKL